jgi:hypothetical protein
MSMTEHPGAEKYLYSDSPHQLCWDNKIPVINNVFWWRRTFVPLAFALLAIAGILIVFPPASGGTTFIMWYILSMPVLFLLIAVPLLLWAFWFQRARGGQKARFFVDDEGAGHILIDTANIFADPAADEEKAGRISWPEVGRAKISEKKQIIFLRRKLWLNPLVLYCTPDNFCETAAFIARHLGPGKIEYVGILTGF